MKKILKLILVFVLVAGGIFLAFNLGSVFKPSGGGFSSSDGVDIIKQSDEIRRDWEEAKGWNEKLYLTHFNTIEQNRKLKQYTAEGYNAVNATLRESAGNAVCNAYWNALKPFAGDKALRSRYNDVRAFSKREDYAKDTRVKEVVAVHGLYEKVARFVSNGSHPLSPEFNHSADPKWTPFSSQKNSVLSTASAYLNDPKFSRISHIPDFPKGLDQSMLTSVLDSQKESFFKKLSENIQNYYEDVPATDESVAELNAIVNRYSDEYSSAIGSNTSHGASSLERFVSNYEARPRNAEQ